MESLAQVPQVLIGETRMATMGSIEPTCCSSAPRTPDRRAGTFVRRGRSGVVLALVLVGGGCMVREPRSGSRSGEDTGTLSSWALEAETAGAGLDAAAERLGAPARGAPEDHRAELSGKRDRLLDAVRAYQSFVDAPWPDAAVTAAVLESALGEAERLHERALRVAQELLDAHRSLEAEAGVGHGTSHSPLSDVEAYLAAADVVASRAREVESRFVLHHTTRLSVRGDDALSAEGRVFHLLRLRALEASDLNERAEDLRWAWQSWVRRTAESGDPASAMSLLAWQFTHCREHAPASLNDVVFVADACVSRPPAPERLESIRRDLRVIEQAWGTGPGGEDGQLEALERARGAILLCRARDATKATSGIRLAVSACERAEALSEAVSVYLMEAGERLFVELGEAGRHTEAVRVFSDLLRPARSERIRALVPRYREYVFERTMVDQQAAMDGGRYAESRSLLGEARELARDDDRALRRVRSALRDSYVADARRLLAIDPDAALRCAREMLHVFPSDPAARRLVDRARVAGLRRKLGDPESSHRRFGARQVLTIFKGTTARILTEEGIHLCQEHLSRIQRSWRRQLALETDPRVIFSLARQLAVLSGVDEAGAVAEATRSLELTFQRAVREEDWAAVEACVDLYASEAEEGSRPANLGEVYLRLLAWLDREGRVEALARHLVVYSASFPGSTDLVEPLVVRHLEVGDDRSLAFYGILRKIHPGSAVLADFERRLSRPVGDVARRLERLTESVTSAVVKDWLSGSRRRLAPPGTSGGGPLAAPSGSGSGGPEPGGEEPVTVGGGGSPARPWRLLLGGCVVTTLLLALMVGVSSVRRGVGSFRWYALVALGAGMSLGVFLGA